MRRTRGVCGCRACAWLTQQQAVQALFPGCGSPAACGAQLPVRRTAGQRGVLAKVGQSGGWGGWGSHQAYAAAAPSAAQAAPSATSERGCLRRCGAIVAERPCKLPGLEPPPARGRRTGSAQDSAQLIAKFCREFLSQYKTAFCGGVDKSTSTAFLHVRHTPGRSPTRAPQQLSFLHVRHTPQADHGGASYPLHCQHDSPAPALQRLLERRAPRGQARARERGHQRPRARLPAREAVQAGHPGVHGAEVGRRHKPPPRNARVRQPHGDGGRARCAGLRLRLGRRGATVAQGWRSCFFSAPSYVCSRRAAHLRQFLGSWLGGIGTGPSISTIISTDKSTVQLHNCRMFAVVPEQPELGQAAQACSQGPSGHRTGRLARAFARARSACSTRSAAAAAAASSAAAAAAAAAAASDARACVAWSACRACTPPPSLSGRRHGKMGSRHRAAAMKRGAEGPRLCPRRTCC